MQYNQKVMRRLSEIKNKKILLVVAHPDDETLWFFQSIQYLRSNNEIIIFCLTQYDGSQRGKELSAAAKELNLKVIFGQCEDTGINHFLNLNEVNPAFVKIFAKNRFDIAITHPIHGGEKPHPHHIQLHNITKHFCDYYLVQFGFFSECIILKQKNNLNSFYFSLQKKKIIINKLIEGYGLLDKQKSRLSFLISNIIEVVFDFKTYSGFEAPVNLEEKQSALENFKSQKDVLKRYETFYRKSEFLFLLQDENSLASPF